MEDKNRRSQCAISMALETIGDKWSLLILRDLMFTNKRSYGELQASGEKIATNILASRLQALEANEIIRKATDPNNGRRSLYFLTAKGIDLLPVIIEIRQWMEKHESAAEKCPEQVNFKGENRDQMLDAFKQKLLEAHEALPQML